MKSVTVTIKKSEDRQTFLDIIKENGLDNEFKRYNSTDWYLEFPDEVDREYAMQEVENIMFEMGFVKGKDYEF